MPHYRQRKLRSSPVPGVLTTGPSIPRVHGILWIHWEYRECKLYHTSISLLFRLLGSAAAICFAEPASGSESWTGEQIQPIVSYNYTKSALRSIFRLR